MPTTTFKRVFLSAFFIVACASGAQAGVIFTPGNHPADNQENILFGAEAESGSMITGQSNRSDIGAEFTSTHTIYLQGGGQAMIEASDQNPNRTDITNLSVSTPGYTFQRFIFNLENGDGLASITARTRASGDFTYDFDLGNGQNFLTVSATGSDSLLSLMIEAEGFLRFKQPRVSGLVAMDGGEETPVPEPITLVLLGGGLAGLSVLRRRRR